MAYSLGEVGHVAEEFICRTHQVGFDGYDQEAEAGEFGRNWRRTNQDSQELDYDSQARALMAGPRGKSSCEGGCGVAGGCAVRVEGDAFGEAVAEAFRDCDLGVHDGRGADVIDDRIAGARESEADR